MRAGQQNGGMPESEHGSESKPTFRDLLSSLEDGWRDYRRELRRPDRDRFDRLWEDASQYADAGDNLNPMVVQQNPMTVAVVSMLLAQEQRIEDLEAELEAQRSE